VAACPVSIFLERVTETSGRVIAICKRRMRTDRMGRRMHAPLRAETRVALMPESLVIQPVWLDLSVGGACSGRADSRDGMWRTVVGSPARVPFGRNQLPQMRRPPYSLLGDRAGCQASRRETLRARPFDPASRSKGRSFLVELTPRIRVILPVNDSHETFGCQLYERTVGIVLPRPGVQ